MVSKARSLADFQGSASALTTGTLPVDRVPYVGRRNLIINGGFDVWQRGTSFNNNVGYTADRWIVATYASDWSSAPATLTKEMLSSPLPDGYQGTYAQYAMQPSSAYFYSRQKVENVRTLGGKTVTLSFWAKVDSGTMGINIDIQNNHGSGGSPDTSTGSNWLTATDTWTKHTLTLNVPSIDGKTIGDNSYSHVWIKSDNGTCANKTFQITQVQLELGSVATPFEHRSYGEELALCQRYYWKSFKQGTPPVAGSADRLYSVGASYGTGADNKSGHIPLPVTMRAQPTITIYRGDASGSNASGTISAYSFGGGWQEHTAVCPAGGGANESFFNFETVSGGVGYAGSFLWQASFTADAEL